MFMRVQDNILPKHYEESKCYNIQQQCDIAECAKSMKLLCMLAGQAGQAGLAGLAEPGQQG